MEAPSRLYKMYSTEGGIRVPLIVRYAGFERSKQGGAIVDAFSTVMDIAATVLDLAGIEHPGRDRLFRGRSVEPLRGKSWAGFFTDAGSASGMNAIHGPDDPAVGWELFGRAALRQGSWKVVYLPPSAGGTGEWELYDLSRDPGETDDASGREPEKLKELLGLWERYVRETGVVWGEALELGTVDVGLDASEVIGGDPLEDTRGWMAETRARSRRRA